ncbi:MAG: HAMP domain-containing protein [Sphingomonadales bacterium]|nr:HAMP domain-containing protein [Sphingomonadales bacterium]
MTGWADVKHDGRFSLGGLSITKKFVGLSIVILSIMLAAAVYAFIHSGRVNREATLLTDVLEPLGHEIDAIEAATSEEELATERALRYGGPQVRDEVRHRAELERFERLNAQVDQGLARLHEHIRKYEGAEVPTDVAIALGRLQIESESLRRDHQAYRQSVKAYLNPAQPELITGKLQRDEIAGGDARRVLASLQRMSAEATRLASADEARLGKLEERGFILSIENLALAVMAFLAGAVLSLLLTRRMLTPVRSLIAGAAEVGRGNLDVAIPSTSRDEIGQLSSAFSAMVGELRTKAAMRDTFTSYLDPRVVDRLLGQGRSELEAGEKREMTVFFSDMQNFSSISETLTPTALVKLINRYLTYAAEPIELHQGVIDKYIGDAIMAYWGAPFTTADPALAAARAALAQRRQVARLQQDLPELLGLRRGAPNIAVRIGLATGDVVAGSIGSRSSKNFTIMGDAVNVASRLEGANKAYGTLILADEETTRLVRHAIEVREIDLLAAVGKTEAVRVFELLGEVGEVDPATLELRGAFAEGLAAYRASDWDRAEAGFAEALRIVPGDGPAQAFIERVATFRRFSPPEDWDGVWQSVAK